MKRIVVAIPVAHGWFWPQTCLTCLGRFPARMSGYECRVVVVNNAWDWSPAIRGITDTCLGEHVEVINNPKGNKFHASALDLVVEKYDCDYFMALESDVCVLRPDWLEWFLCPLEAYPNWFAVGHFHHEGFVNPSCTLYRASVLRDMAAWCKENKTLELRWGERFEKVAYEKTLPHDGYRTKEEILDWLAGPFSEKRGWPGGAQLREPPIYQNADPGHYEPGQALYHWARNRDDLGYLACPTQTAWKQQNWPYQTVYGDHHELPDRELELKELLDSGFYACHFWLGTGSLNILKHEVTQQHREFMFYGLPREGRFWKQVVPEDVQRQTIKLIREYGWHTNSKRVASGTYQNITDAIKADSESALLVESIYRDKAGIPL